jgi:hypothetical protein
MTLFHLLIVLAVALFLFFGRKIPDIMRPFGGGPGSGTPTHPLPVTSPVETSRGSGDPNTGDNPGNGST